MIRVFFVFEDPFDEAGVNLSFVDVPTESPTEAFQRVEHCGETGELWQNLYPDVDQHPYSLIKGKMMYFNMSNPSSEHSAETLLAAPKQRTD